MPASVNDQEQEQLSQYVDGELHGTALQALERRLEAEPSLRAQLQAMQSLNSRLQSALSHRDGVPQSVFDALASSNNADAEGPEPAGTATVLAFPGSRASSHRPAASSTMFGWPMAAAASLLVALAAVLMNGGTGEQSGLPGNDGLVSAALDSAPSGDEWVSLKDGRALQPVLTFAHRDGTWCREYLLREAAQDVRAVACQQGGRWVTQAAGFEAYLDSTSAYRPAGASDSAPVSVFISENAAGIALGREEERALIEQGWR